MSSRLNRHRRTRARSYSPRFHDRGEFARSADPLAVPPDVEAVRERARLAGFCVDWGCERMDPHGPHGGGA